MSWLSRLPHQIPFRAASSAEVVDERTITGVFAVTANDPMPPQLMVVEAMAQLAGSLVFEEAAFLTGIDRCELLREVVVGERVVCTVSLEAEFGGTFRFSGVGRVDGVETVRGRFYLASPAHAQT